MQVEGKVEFQGRWRQQRLGWTRTAVQVQLLLIKKGTGLSNGKVDTSDWWSNRCRGPVVSIGEIGLGPDGLSGKRQSWL